MSEKPGGRMHRYNKKTTQIQHEHNTKATENLHVDAKRLDDTTENLHNTNIEHRGGEYVMDDTKEVAAELQALARNDATARTKMGRLRQLLPEIEAAQAAGISHEQILAALNKRGFDLKMGPYSTMLWRIRNAKAKGNAAVPRSVPAARAAAESTPKEEMVQSPPPMESSDSEGELSDAMETKKRRDEKSRRFITDNANPLLKKLKGGNQ